jgi:hypothetical protein
MARRALFVMLGAAFAAGALASVQASTTAVEDLARLNARAHADRETGNTRDRVRCVLEMERLLNGAPNAVRAAARVYAEAGDPLHALAALERYARLGQSDPTLLSGSDARFSSLVKRPRYKAILRRLAANAAPVSRAERALLIADSGLLAEDIDYDAGSDSFLVTSVLEDKIVRIARDGRLVNFASSPSRWPMLALKIDAEHHRVWATEVAMSGFDAVPAGERGRSALLSFDLLTGALESRVQGPEGAELGDLVLTREGQPLVSDGTGGGVYRLTGNQLERLDRGEFISPQTPVAHPDGRHLIIPDYARGIGVLDLQTRALTWLASEGRHALYGIDGLYLRGATLVATQNGSVPERVVEFGIDATLRRVESELVVERATSNLGDPTHGVVVGSFFYYIANSGWDQLDEHGRLKKGGHLTPAVLMRFRLEPPPPALPAHARRRLSA